ncbi:MAG: type II toxin-antitoxin system HicA family toxin [SAR202 cluster bacterium]|nr:type II toxin-antitoxin system HicA family toxin [SAR202 cluster bacterium]
MRPLTYREVICRLNSVGFFEVSQRGSHVKFAKTTADGTFTAIVPRHQELAVGTLRSILRQAGIAAEEWETL